MTYAIGTFLAADGLAIPADVKLVRTTGYAADGDAGSAIYAEAATEPATPAKFQDASLRWFGLASGQAVTPEKFGAVEPAADATAAVQAALDFAGGEGGGTVELLRMYLVSTELEAPQGVAIRGPRSAGLRRIDEVRTTTTSTIAAGSGSRTFTVTSAAGFAVGQSVILVSGSAYSPNDPYSHRNPVITAVSGNSITIDTRSAIGAHAAGAVLQTASHGLILLGGNQVEGITIDGNEANQTDAVWRTTTELVIEGSGCTVEDVAIVRGASDLVLVAGYATSFNPIVGVYVENSRFIGCDFEDAGNNGIHLSFTAGALVEGCRFRRLNRRNAGINVEHQDGGVICSYNNRDVIVSGCDFEEMYDAVGNIDQKVAPEGEVFNHGFVVTGCRIHNCHRPLRVLNRGSKVVFEGNRVSADYPYTAGLDDSRVYLFGTSLSERAGRVIVCDNEFTNVRIASTNVRGLVIEGNEFDLTAQSAAGTIHPLFLSNTSEATIAGNVVRGGGYGVRLLNFGGAGDMTDIVVADNQFVDQRWTGIRGDSDAPGPVEALVRGNAISNDAASAIGAGYRALRLLPGMYAEGNRISLAVGSAWDLTAAGSGPSRGRNLVAGVVEEPGNFADISGTSYTLALGDAGGYRRTTSASAVTVTVPANAAAAFPLGTEVAIEQGGDGPVTLAGASGVTLSSYGGGLTTAGRHAVARLVKTGTDAWTASGDLEADILSLFSGGAKGVLYDVSDMASMFQDDAGTVPAAVDSPVGRMLDRSGNGFHAVQATAAARPILRQSGGRSWLEFDGTSKFMTISGISATASPWTLSAGVDPTQTTIAYLIDVQTGRLIFATREGTADDFVSYYEGAAWRRGGATAAGAQVLSWKLEAGAGAIRRNGAAIASGLAYTNRAIGGSVALGRHNSSAAAFLKGKLYGLVLVNRALPAGELAMAETWAAERAGVTL